MRIHRLQRRQRLDQPLDVVFAFFARARNLERITREAVSQLLAS